MGRTIGHKWPKSWGVTPPAPCAYCRAYFPRHRLTRLRNGLLACVDNDAIGKDEVELSETRLDSALRYRNYVRTHG